MGSFLERVIFCQNLSKLSLFRQKLKSKESLNAFQFDKDTQVKAQNDGVNLYNRINKQNSTQLSASCIWKAIFAQFKEQIYLCYFLKQMDYIFKFLLCFLVSLIFQSFQKGQLSKSYLLSGIVGVVWILQAIFNQCSLNQVQQSSLKIKGSLTYAIYLKVLSISNFSINGKQSGQIINAIVEFHDILENQSIHMFSSLSAPICILGVAILLVYQMGWMSLVGVSFYLFLSFIQYHYSDYNSRYFEQISKLKDERVQILAEAISAFRYIKMQLWEKLFMNKINKIRSRQMNGFIKYSAGKSFEQSLNQGTYPIIILLIVGLAARTNDGLTSKEMLSSVLNVFLLNMYVVYSTFGVNCYYRVSILFERVASVFAKQNKPNLPTDEPKEIDYNKTFQQQALQNNPIVLESLWCSYKQNIEQQCILKQVNLSIKKGEFIGLFGKVGKGKSTFFYTLAKQMTNVKGKATITEEVSFQQSQPALFIGTVKENILFGKQFNRSMYKKSIKYSCLASDIKLLPLGDQTLIEQGGVNLSGGQKTRLCLARAIYANKPILLLDDPLSSVDIKVMQRIVSNLFKLNKQQGKTIILGTHQIHCLINCDRCLQVRDSNLHELTTQQFQTLKQDYKTNKQEQNVSFSTQSIDKEQQQQSTLQLMSKVPNKQTKQTKQTKQIPQNGFIYSLFSYAFKNKYNYLTFPATLFCYITCQTSYYLFIFYLNKYDEVKIEQNSTFRNQQSLWLFLGLVAGFVYILNNVRSFLLNLTIHLANKALHNQGLQHVFKAKILELDKIGTKGILDKFSTDLGLLDGGISLSLHCQILVIVTFTIQLIIISVVNPIMIPFIIAILIPNFLWYLYSTNTISALKQMDLRQKGPVISLFSETINGLAQIHVMKAQEHMLDKIKTTLNKSIQMGVNYRNTYRAYAALLNYYTTFVIIGSYFAIIAMNGSANYTNFTFAAVFLVQANDWIIWAFQFATSINSTLVSATRLASLSEIKTEVYAEVQNQQTKKQSSQVRINLQENDITKPDLSIQLHNICLRYGQEQNLALKHVSISIKSGQKVALIGRTGSGKSSIIQVLYRLVEAESGSKYFIEGENALMMNIEHLRQKFTCIPQTPFIYSDQLRSNLDPFGKFSDQEIKQALTKVCIYQFVESLPNGIHTSLANGKISLSGGQKQLICLARAILQNKGFLILDEATSNIDQETDIIIQKVLRKEFVGKTIICVAHRLQTILDFDKIIVLSHGQILQQGRADKLMSNRKEFYQMVCESSYENTLIRKILKTEGQR